MQKAKFLDKKKVIEKLSKIALKVRTKDKNIEKIILFGSLAKDTYTGISDADLLIILKKSTLRFIDRIPQYSFLFLNAPIPVDVFPYTEEEIERIPFAKRAISEGIALN